MQGRPNLEGTDDLSRTLDADAVPVSVQFVDGRSETQAAPLHDAAPRTTAAPDASTMVARRDEPVATNLTRNHPMNKQSGHTTAPNWQTALILGLVGVAVGAANGAGTGM